jgi:hypothetical protein
MMKALTKRPLSFQRNVVLLASGLSVGVTKCYFLQGHPGWQGYLSCFVLGYFVAVIVTAIASVLASQLLDIDFKAEHERLTIITGVTLIVVSLLLLIGRMTEGAIDIDDD